MDQVVPYFAVPGLWSIPWRCQESVQKEIDSQGTQKEGAK